MAISAVMHKLRHMDESQLAAGYADMLSQVAIDHRPVILRRGGTDFAAVIPLEYLELIRDSLARQEAERVANLISWDQAKVQSPPQSWFEGEEPKPF